MPRAKRICFPGAIFHITVKGDNGESIFMEDSDKREFLIILWRFKKIHGFYLFSFVIMINHGHLVIQVNSDIAISKIMHDINSTYSRRFNWNHNRKGHVFQERFHAKLIQEDSYLLEATRYDHLNPARAKIVSKPENYLWSSYRAYLNMTPQTVVDVDKEKVLDMVSPNKEKQISLYKNFVESANENDIRKLEEFLLVPGTCQAPGRRHQVG